MAPCCESIASTADSMAGQLATDWISQAQRPAALPGTGLQLRRRIGCKWAGFECCCGVGRWACPDISLCMLLTLRAPRLACSCLCELATCHAPDFASSPPVMLLTLQASAWNAPPGSWSCALHGWCWSCTLYGWCWCACRHRRGLQGLHGECHRGGGGQRAHRERG